MAKLCVVVIGSMIVNCHPELLLNRLDNEGFGSCSASNGEGEARDDFGS